MENKSTEQEQQAALHKTDCYTALELLAQMLSEETTAAAQSEEMGEMLERYKNADYIRHVIQMIKEREANAV